MRDRDGHHHQDHGGGAVGQLADSGGGGHAALLRAQALRARRRRQVRRPAPAGRRYPPSRCADGRACSYRAGPSSVPGILSPRKITVKGRSLRSRLRWRYAPPLSVIFHGKTSAPIRRTGAMSGD